MKFTLKHIFNTDIDTFWNKVFFDEEYNRDLYAQALDFPVFKILELTGEPGQDRTRRLLTEPKSDAPAVVTKLVGGNLQYTETGRWDARTKVWTYDITTSKLADKVKIGGKFWVEPRGDKKIERICECEVKVKIFGVGGVVESFIEKTTRESYEKTAAFTNRWLADKGYNT